MAVDPSEFAVEDAPASPSSFDACLAELDHREEVAIVESRLSKRPGSLTQIQIEAFQPPTVIASDESQETAWKTGVS